MLPRSVWLGLDETGPAYFCGGAETQGGGGAIKQTLYILSSIYSISFPPKVRLTAQPRAEASSLPPSHLPSSVQEPRALGGCLHNLNVSRDEQSTVTGNRWARPVEKVGPRGHKQGKAKTGSSGLWPWAHRLKMSQMSNFSLSSESQRWAHYSRNAIRDYPFSTSSLRHALTHAPRQSCRL